MELPSSTGSQVYAPKADGSRTTLYCPVWGRAKTRLVQVLEESGFRVERALSKSETGSDNLQQARIVRTRQIPRKTTAKNEVLGTYKERKGKLETGKL
jgi:hypothetical protein